MVIRRRDPVIATITILIGSGKESRLRIDCRVSTAAITGIAMVSYWRSLARLAGYGWWKRIPGWAIWV
jgi:hypothetical protein